MNIRTTTLAGALALSALAAPMVYANDAVRDLGGRVISTQDTVISEIGGSPGAAYEDTIVEEYVYVTAPVENYLPPVTYASPAQTGTVASASGTGYSSSSNYMSSSGYTGATYTYSSSLANTGAAVLGLVLAAFISALVGLGTLAHKKRNKREEEHDN